MRLPRVFHGHEVGYLGDAVRIEEPRQQHVGVREIELLARGTLEERRDLESSATLGIDEGCEDRWRVEVRQAEEVDGSVHAHQSNGVEVADDTVFPDGRITTRHQSAPANNTTTERGSAR